MSYSLSKKSRKETEIKELEGRKRICELLAEIKESEGMTMLLDKLTEQVNMINQVMCWNREAFKDGEKTAMRDLDEDRRIFLTAKREAYMELIETFPSHERALESIEAKIKSYGSDGK